MLVCCDAKVTTTDNCGDGFLDPGEACDGALPGGQSCSSLGYYGGNLCCLAATCDYNLTSCESYGFCGDGTVQSAYDEECDHENLNSETCATSGYFTGDLSCAPSCEIIETGCLDILSISAGYYHTCALRTDRTIRCWGFNNFGRLGIGTDTPSLVPTPVSGINTAEMV